MGGRYAMQQTRLNLSIFMNKDSKGSKESCHQSVETVGVWCGGCSSRAQIRAQHLLLWQECMVLMFNLFQVAMRMVWAVRLTSNQPAWLEQLSFLSLCLVFNPTSGRFYRL